MSRHAQNKHSGPKMKNGVEAGVVPKCLKSKLFLVHFFSIFGHIEKLSMQ